MLTLRIALIWAAVFALSAVIARPASALPSFARQTGQECAACHNGFPELTPYGRLFKLNGYVFPGEKSEAPPISAMMVTSFTHTNAPQVGGAAPHFAANDNVAFEFGSLFYGGAIVPQWGIGAFIQTTYNHISQRYSWDNSDVRWSRSTAIGGKELVYGLSLNNNPTVTDLWNTTPAWRYPFQSSGLAPTPPTATFIEGALTGNSLGVTSYMFWNRLVYAEIGGYHTLSSRLESVVGVDSTGSSSTNGPALYWRVAVEPNWGRHSLEVGTFGMQASVFPGRVQDFGSDDYTDIGVDSQYQFLSNDYSFSLQASRIMEDATLNSTFTQGGSDTLHSSLATTRVKATVAYDQTYALTGSYFRVDGHANFLAYGAISASNSPNSSGIIGELDYTPFNHGGPSFWPWANLRLGLQYVHYLKFNGGTTNYDGYGANATGNDTLYLFAWLAF